MTKRRITHASTSTAKLRALGTILAIEARRDPEVQAFRREVLGGRVFTPEEAKRWLYERKAEEEQDPKPWRTLSLPKELQVGGTYVLKIAQGGALSRLKKAAEELVKTGYWTEPMAVRFLLCDLPPVISPVKFKVTYSWHPDRNRIVLDIDRNATVAEVVQAFKLARRMTPTGELVARYRRSRPLSEKHLQLAVFLANTPELTWENRMQQWNKMWEETHPSRLYQDLREFRRDSVNAYQRVRGLKWKQRERRKAALEGSP